MTVSKSPRLNLTRWSDDTDPWSRQQFDDNNAELEARVVTASSGGTTGQPSAAGSAGKRFYWDTEAGQLNYDVGGTWISIVDNRTPAGVTNGPNINAANTKCVRRTHVSVVTMDFGFTVAPGAGGTTTAFPAGTTLFTLPLGHRPPASAGPTYAQLTVYSATIGNGTTCVVTVGSSGVVTAATPFAANSDFRAYGQIIIPL